MEQGRDVALLGLVPRTLGAHICTVPEKKNKL